jgi:hypothetical protein
LIYLRAFRVAGTANAAKPPNRALEPAADAGRGLPSIRHWIRQREARSDRGCRTSAKLRQRRTLAHGFRHERRANDCLAPRYAGRILSGPLRGSRATPRG